MFTFFDSTFTTTTKQAIFFALLTIAALALPAQAKAGALTGDAIGKTIGGHTLVLSAMGVQLPIAYRANGTMTGSMAAYVASLAGESRLHDSGTWWVQGGRLCQRWNSWLDGKTYCFTLSSSGSLIHWSAGSGQSGTARISN